MKQAPSLSEGFFIKRGRLPVYRTDFSSSEAGSQPIRRTFHQMKQTPSLSDGLFFKRGRLRACWKCFYLNEVGSQPAGWTFYQVRQAPSLLDKLIINFFPSLCPEGKHHILYYYVISRNKFLLLERRSDQVERACSQYFQ